METAKEYWEAQLKNKAESTKTNYRIYLNKFLTKYGLTHEELYRLQRDAEESKDRRATRKVPLMVSNFMHEMIENGYSNNTALMVVKAVTLFFEANEISFKIRKDDKPSIISQGSRLILKNQIREFMDFVGAHYPKRNRALIYLLKDSGLRVSDISSLNVEDYLNAREVKNEYGERFKIFEPFKTQKTGHYSYCIIGPESVETLDNYLGNRKTGPLFLGREGKGKLTRLSADALTALFLRMGKELENGNKITAHSFRKFHRTQLSAKMNDEWIKLLQGKSADVYVQPYENGQLFEAYIKAYDQLRIKTTDLERETYELRTVAEKQADEIKTLKEVIDKQGEWILKLMERASMDADFRIEVKRYMELRQKPLQILEGS